MCLSGYSGTIVDVFISPLVTYLRWSSKSNSESEVQLKLRVRLAGATPLAVLLPWGLATGRPVVAVASLPVGVLAFWRFVDQRVKATSQAYWYMITLEGGAAGGRSAQPAARTGEVSHAGGVVFKQVGRQVQYLLVSASNPSVHEWVLPKGHLEPFEQSAETAVREVREETGVWARVECELGTRTFVVAGEEIHVRFYLMQFLKETWPDEKRRHEWVSLERAIQDASYDESRQLIAEAGKLMAARQPSAATKS